MGKLKLVKSYENVITIMCFSDLTNCLLLVGLCIKILFY